MNEHDTLIRQCYELSSQAVEAGNHPFGALLVVDDQVVLTQQNKVNSRNDATQHAEMELVRAAAIKLTHDEMGRAILYTSTEPCVMCAGAIYWSGIAAVVYGCSAAALGKITGGSLVVPCRDIFKKGQRSVAVCGPILQSEGVEIHRSFW